MVNAAFKYQSEIECQSMNIDMKTINGFSINFDFSKLIKVSPTRFTMMALYCLIT